MDFSFTDEQHAVRDVAQQILDGQVTHDRLKDLAAAGEHVDRRAWAELAKANLLGIALPEDVGGSGLGFIELCLILEQVGRTVAPVPLLPTLVMGGLPIAEFGTTEQKHELLPPVVAGDVFLTAALVEFGTEPARPATTAARDNGKWRLDGVKVCVPGGLEAGRVLVPASTGEGQVGVFIVDPAGPGVSATRQETTTGIPEARIEFSGASADVLGQPDDGAAIVDWIVDRTTTGLCAVATGVCAEALKMTAEYASTRHQFDKPIGTFQAVGQRAADAYIDTEAIRLTMWQAAWRIHEGLPAAAQVATAKFWAAEGGQRVVHAAQHIHGGIGVDRDYPLHRYFLWAKQLELTLGGASRQLRRLGQILASEPV